MEPNPRPLAADEYWVVELTDWNTKQRRLAMPDGYRAFHTIHRYDAEEYARHFNPEQFPTVRRARITVEVIE